MEAQVKMEKLRRWRGIPCCLPWKGLRLTRVEKGQGWALPGSPDLHSNHSPSCSDSRHLTDCLTGGPKGGSSESDGWAESGFPMQSSLLPCELWGRTATPAVTVLLIVQDPAWISPSPLEHPPPRLQKESFWSPGLLSHSESYLNIYQNQLSIRRLHLRRPPNPKPILCIFGLLQEPWGQWKEWGLLVLLTVPSLLFYIPLRALLPPLTPPFCSWFFIGYL